MFIDIRNLQERRQERDRQFEGTRDIRQGYLFEVNGSIEGDRSGLVWFKALDGDSQPFQVFYNGLIGDLRPNMFVRIERNPKEPSRWQIIQFDTGIYFDDQSTFEQLPSTSFIPAKEDYEWPPGFPGAKALNIFPRAITDFAVRPTSPASMKARVYSGIYPGATNYERFQGPVNTKDFTADVPGAGLARLAAISIDNTGTLNYTNGTTFVDGLPMPDASLPAVPASQMLISAIRLVNGMTAIEESNFDLEMRPLMANGTVNAKVSEVWESDFGAVALQADATGQIGIGTSAPATSLTVVNNNESLTLTDFTQALTKAGIHIETEFTVDAYTPGLFWSTSDNNPTKPKAGVWLKETNIGTYLFLGTSDFYSTGITNMVVIDPDGHMGVGTVLPGDDIHVQASAADLGIRVTGSGAGGAFIAVDGIGAANGYIDLYRSAGSIAVHMDAAGDSYFSATGGNFGVGLTSPQGKVHAYDSISGFLLWEFDGLDGTTRTVIPNGTGDVLYGARVFWVMRTTSGVQASSATIITGGAPQSAVFGGVTVAITANADGSVTIVRTVGTLTVKVALMLRWL